MPTTPSVARRTLDKIATDARNIREALSAEVDRISKHPDYSESYRASKLEQARAMAARTFADMQRQLDQAAADLAAYPIAGQASDAALTRAAARVSQLLDGGASLVDVLNLAAKNRDTAMIEAAREAAPVRIHLDTRGGVGSDQDASDRLDRFTKSADVAMARALAGTPAGRDAADAILGRATVALTAHELTAAHATAAGQVSGGLEHAVTAHYARQEVEALTTQLAQPTA